MRRSLVVLSLLALSFALAACGSSDGDDGTGDGPVTPSRVPAQAHLLDFPTSIDLWQDGAGGVMGFLEGMPINLQGVRALVVYTDGYQRIETDVRQFTIDPPVYTLTATRAGSANLTTRATPWGQVGDTFGGTERTDGVEEYILTLVVGTRAFHFEITNDTVIAAGHHGAIGHVQPLINVELFGSMSHLDFFVDDVPQFPSSLILQGVWGRPDANQADWYRARFPYPNIYPWRWVFNEDAFAEQNPGVLMQFGSWGDITGDGWDPAGGDWEGLRIPVRNLWQVYRIEFDPPELVFAEPIFFDDPFLLGAAAEGWRLENWTRGVLGGNTLVVHYRGGFGATPPPPRSFPFADFANFQTVQSGQWGIWAAPTITFETGTAADAQDFGDGLGVRRPSAELNPASIEFGWSDWLRTANQRISIRYRSAPPVVVRVPIYNALASIEVTSPELVVLNGFGAIDVRPEGQTEFLRRVTILGNYTQNLGGPPAQRDIQAAMAAGRMRGIVSPSADGTADTTATEGTPLIGHGGWFNTVGTDIDEGVALTTNIHQMGSASSEWMHPTLFTQRNSNLFFTAGTTRNIRVEVQPQLLQQAGSTGVNADPSQSRATRNVNVPFGLLNYTWTPPN